MSKFKKCFLVLMLGVFTVLGYFAPTILSNGSDRMNETTKMQMQFSSLDLTGRSVSNVVERMKLIREVSSPVILESEEYLSDEYYQKTLDEINLLLSNLDIPFEVESTMIIDAQLFYYMDILDSSKAILAWEFIILDSSKDIWISTIVDDAAGQVLSLFVNDINGSSELSISTDRFDAILKNYMEYLTIGSNYSVSQAESNYAAYNDPDEPNTLATPHTFEIEINKDSISCIINAAYSENGFYINYNN